MRRKNISTYKGKWEKSYARTENFIFYPKEEVVKFLNRFVRKKTAPNGFTDITDFSHKVRGLDYGCGIGRQTVLMREFGIDAYGLDISRNAIRAAQRLASYLGYGDLKDKFKVIDGNTIPFKDGFFDVTVAESVLDSMHFDLAKLLFKEINRVTRKLVFISLIGGDNGHKPGYRGEGTVKTRHEKGTIQSYYDMKKIKELISGTGLKLAWCHRVTDESMISDYRYSRYYLVLVKKEAQV